MHVLLQMHIEGMIRRISLMDCRDGYVCGFYSGECRVLINVWDSGHAEDMFGMK